MATLSGDKAGTCQGGYPGCPVWGCKGYRQVNGPATKANALPFLGSLLVRDASGNERKFAPVKKLNRELALLENALGCFAEFENYANSVWLVEWWNDGWRVTGTSSLQFAEVDQLLEWAHGVLVS